LGAQPLPGQDPIDGGRRQHHLDDAHAASATRADGDADCVASGVGRDTGYCVVDSASSSHMCATGQVASVCDDDGDCSVGVCRGGTFSKWCTEGRAGESCSDVSDCQTAYCAMVGVGGICTDGNAGDLCEEDDECRPGLGCANAAGNRGTCTAGGLGDPCDEAVQCVSGYCSNQQNSFGICTDGGIGADCGRQDDDCQSGLCVWSVPNSGGMCSDGATGSPCTEAMH